MDYTKLFYWLVIADNAKVLFGWGIFIFMVVSIISTIALIVSATGKYSEKDEQMRDIRTSRKWMFWSYPICFLWWSLYIFTPDKKDSLLIVAGGGTLNYLTTDSTAQQIPKELSNFVVTQLKTMAKENEVDLNIKDQKNKILEEAKKMSTEEVLNKIKTDSIYKKVLLEN